MKWLLDWLDHRTGYRQLIHEALYEHIPGGARWRYVWGSTLTFTFTVQIITGLFLWLAYNPSSQTAWESVYYIQYQMWGGWLLRGIHHYTAQAMNILLVLHLLQVVIDGAYKAPREINFWFGLGLLGLVMGLSLTGYLLPWDQKGYWATKVATNIMGVTPVIGPALQKIVVGGVDYGHHTLSRFFALHAGVLPAAVVALIAAHIYLFRKHGITARRPYRKPDARFWPDQVLMDCVACLAVLAAVLFFVVRRRLFDEAGPLGAELGPPADPSEPFPARPEWYFLFLFQFLKYQNVFSALPGSPEVWGAIVAPGVVTAILFLQPVIARRRWGHAFNVTFLWCVLAAVAALTILAIQQDRNDADYQAAVRKIERDAGRVRKLAQSPSGIPPTGAVTLLRNDPLTQGPALFAKNCAGCHRYGGHDALGRKPKDAPSAADLKGFATREWLTGFFDPKQIAEPHYYGATKFKEGKMVRFVQRDVAKYGDTEKLALTNAIIALSAEAGLKARREPDARDAAAIVEGRKAITDTLGCLDCHTFHNKDEDATAPDLTGYGSREWLMGIIADAAHARFYGKRNDRMPRFGVDGALTDREIGLLADWLRGEWYEADGVKAAGHKP